MNIQRNTSKQRGKEYHSILLVESYRDHNDGGKPKKRTVANLSNKSEEEIRAIEFGLKNKKNLDRLVDVTQIKNQQGKSIGAVATLYEIARRLGIVKALGRTRESKLMLWMVIARLIQPKISRLAAVRLTRTHAAKEVLGLDDFTEDHLHDTLNWACEHQSEIETRLFKHRYPNLKPTLYLYDVTSSYLEGKQNELAAWGYNRDKKKGKMQIVIGLLTDDEGWPISVEVFKGNTLDIQTFSNQIKKMAEKFRCDKVTFVGDRGMIKCRVKERAFALPLLIEPYAQISRIRLSFGLAPFQGTDHREREARRDTRPISSKTLPRYV
jgi:hypothetical protein